jgi:hypothetical protein
MGGHRQEEILIHWKKFACGDFFETLPGRRRQKARLLPPAEPRGYAFSEKDFVSVHKVEPTSSRA